MATTMLDAATKPHQTLPCTELCRPKSSTLEQKSVEPTVLIPITVRIQQRAYELYEQRGRTDGHDLDDWLQAECDIRGTHANAAAA
jgi:hypothetical protein